MTCPLCGGHAELIVRVPAYKIDVCEPCWDGAQAGWPRTAEAKLFEALAAAGLLIPDRNDNGHLPRQYAPPEDLHL